MISMFFMWAGVTHSCAPFRSEAVLTSLWMSNLFPSLLPSPSCLVQKKQRTAAPSRRKGLCQFIASLAASLYERVWSDSSVFKPERRNAAAEAWRTRSGTCGGSETGRFDRALDRNYWQTVEGRSCGGSVSYQRLLTAFCCSSPPPQRWREQEEINKVVLLIRRGGGWNIHGNLHLRRLTRHCYGRGPWR